MDSLKMQSPNLVNDNIEKIAALFPNCITEDRDENGTVRRVVDFDLLRQELSEGCVEGPRERFHLNWPGKREALLIANAPISKTLRPCEAESVEFENTKNVYIDGDNLDALKLLQELYLNKIRLIYIDPPYNTGNDFIYDDNFAESTDEYLKRSNQFDKQGNRLIANTEANGRFHSDWLTFIYPRLKLSRNLLRDDGLICISIGQDEIASCTLMADEIYGENNRISICTRLMKSGGQKGRYFSPNTDYVLIYAKDINCLNPFRGELSQELQDKVYNQIETDGPRAGERYRAMGMFQPLDARPNQRYYVECPDGTYVIPPGQTFPKTISDLEKVRPDKGDGVWRWIPERYDEERKKGNIIYKETDKSPLLDQNGNQAKWNIYYKIWLKDRLDEGSVPSDCFDKFENRHGAKELNELDITFDFPKPTDLISYLMLLSDVQDTDIVMDFFSGAGATAHAAFKYNVQQSRDVKWILVQLPELVSEGNAHRAGFNTIAEIGRERIRRAGKKIKEDNPVTAKNLDTGFRVFKIDTSNMEDVYYTPDELKQDNLELFKDHIKPDRTPEDLLFQVFIDWGLDLTLPIAKETIDGKTVFLVDTNALIACFDAGINEELVKKLAAHKPLRAVFRDDAFGSDSVKINVEQIFKSLSPVTEVKSI